MTNMIAKKNATENNLLSEWVAEVARLTKPEREGLDLAKKLRLYAGEAVEGVPETEATRLDWQTRLIAAQARAEALLAA